MSTPEPAAADRAKGLALLAAVSFSMVVTCASFNATGPGPGETVPGGGFAIDVNAADAATLQLLPGVGPALARRILQERSRGAFSAAEGLERVHGVGPKTVARLKPYAVFTREAKSDDQ